MAMPKADNKLENFVFGLLMVAVMVAFMCPIMTLLATILFEFPGWNNVVFTWLETFVVSFPAALFWNIFYGGPLARCIFGLIFCPRGVDKDLAKVAKDTD